MEFLALFLAVAALAAWGAWGFRSQNRQVAEILSRLDTLERRGRPIYEARYAPPIEDIAPGDALPPMDTAGAWAYELQSLGVRVPDEVLNEQRQMRLVAGL